MCARKEKDVPFDPPHAVDHPVCPCPDLVRGFPARTAVTKQLPVRALREDVGAGTTFVRAVVPFEQVRFDFRRRPEASQLARLDRPLQGAREHRGEPQSRQPLSEPDGLGLAVCRQRQVGHPRVLTRNRPGRLPVPGEVCDRKRVAHGCSAIDARGVRVRTTAKAAGQCTDRPGRENMSAPLMQRTCQPAVAGDRERPLAESRDPVRHYETTFGIADGRAPWSGGANVHSCYDGARGV